MKKILFILFAISIYASVNAQGVHLTIHNKTDLHLDSLFIDSTYVGTFTKDEIKKVTVRKIRFDSGQPEPDRLQCKIDDAIVEKLDGPECASSLTIERSGNYQIDLEIRQRDNRTAIILIRRHE